ncbi:MAG: protein-export chaperone SecB [Pseudomonadota bacterium]
MAEETEQNIQAGHSGAPSNEFVIQKLYVKDLSFETPNSPQIFLEQWKPDVKLQLRSQAAPQSADVYEVVLTLNITATLGEKTAYLVEVQQAGIFSIKGFSEADMGAMLGSYCPTILFPYAREVVSDLVTKGGFPQLLLAPVNFDALYAHMQTQKAQGESAH